MRVCGGPSPTAAGPYCSCAATLTSPRLGTLPSTARLSRFQSKAACKALQEKRKRCDPCVWCSGVLQVVSEPTSTWGHFTWQAGVPEVGTCTLTCTCTCATSNGQTAGSSLKIGRSSCRYRYCTSTLLQRPGHVNDARVTKFQINHHGASSPWQAGNGVGSLFDPGSRTKTNPQGTPCPYS